MSDNILGDLLGGLMGGSQQSEETLQNQPAEQAQNGADNNILKTIVGKILDSGNLMALTSSPLFIKAAEALGFTKQQVTAAAAMLDLYLSKQQGKSGTEVASGLMKELGFSQDKAGSMLKDLGGKLLDGFLNGKK